MNAPQNHHRSTGARRAWAQPRFLLGAAAFALVGATWAAFAAPAPATKAPVAMPHTSSKGTDKPYSLADLPALVARYGESRRLAATPVATGGRTTRAVGTGVTGFNLVETDLTPGSPSDEREPVVSPSGDFIAFTSTGADSNNDGRIDSLSNGGFRHIWLMNRDGSGARQVTGLTNGLDDGRNQTHPTFSPDGNQIAYSDEEPATLNGNPNSNAGGSQLYVVSALDANPTPTQRTFFGEDPTISKSAPAFVQSPAWAPSGLSIAFVTNYDGRQDGRDDTVANPRSLLSKDIFSIAPDGSTTSLTRITGDSSTDPIGSTTDDDHPAWATVNTSVLFFSSNRDVKGKLTDTASTTTVDESQGRRIWRIFSDGTGPNPVTDPLQRTNGQADDRDDYPIASIRGTGSQEQIAFQTNTFLDDSDQADGPRGRDLNIWSLPVSTSSFTAAEPRTYVGSFDDGKVVGVNSRTLQVSQVVPRIPADTTQTIPSVEDVLVSPNGQYVFVCDRNYKRVLRFNEQDGTAAGSATFTNSSLPTNAAQFTPSTITNPVGLAIFGNSLYVTSGFQNTNPTPTIYRFNLDTGAAAPSAINSTDTTGLFSSGDTTGTGVISNGAEGIAITSDGAYIAVAGLVDNKINLYNRQTGAYVPSSTDGGTFVSSDTASNGGLNLPTGITWGPDLNGDGNQDLYVCSSGTDEVKVYSGPNLSGGDPFASVGAAGSSGATRPGTFIGNLIAEPAGSDGVGVGTTGLNGPERIRIADLATDGTGAFGADGIPEVYVSSFRTLGTPGNGIPGGGFQVNRYELDTASAKAFPWPAGSPSPSTTPTNARYISLPPDQFNASTVSLKGAASFDFNRATLNQVARVNTAAKADETPGGALVLTNILSSPDNFAASRLTSPQSVDHSADREPAFSRTTTSGQDLARLVFVSGRLLPPNTTSNTAITALNPKGGDQFNNAGVEDTGITHDIWTTSTRDLTPPALIPQGAGNLQFPVVAPQSSSPFFAPRTVEAGLKPGLVPTTAEMAELTSATGGNTYATRGGLRFAVVLRDLESGFKDGTTATTGNGSVIVQLFNADSPQFRFNNDLVNDNQLINVATELKARQATINGQTSFALNIYDDGPASSGGHEQQAAAVKGDGNFYCEALLPTPAVGDYYIDVTATDRVGNSLTYDNIWGISTRLFTRQASGNSDLFVSDYTAGQRFPFRVSGDIRFANMPPVESYFLTNPGGQTVDKATLIVSTNGSIPQTFSNVDVWRVLCRGPVTQDVLNAYRPTIVKQIDPGNPNPTSAPPAPTSTPAPGATATPAPTAGPTPTPTATPIPFSQLTRNVPISKSAVIWAAPYAGTTFVGPGTITDATTQASLNSFLNDGGRLFITGRDVARALSSNGIQNNSFLKNDLAAAFAGESQSNVLTPGPGSFYSGDFKDLQIPYHYTVDGQNTYEDAALTQDPPPDSGILPNSYDLISPQAASGVALSTAYLGNGSPVGQRVVKTGSNSLESRVVFFSFGFEAINRRYSTTPNTAFFQNVRRNVANSILSYFKTTAVSGTVFNSTTNSGVPNFLIKVVGAGYTFFARTDARGNYSVSGLPEGSYVVSVVLDANGDTSPGGFFGGTPVGSFFLPGGSAGQSGLNLQVTPALPGGIIGRAVASNGTLSDRSNDTPLPNLQVLVRSIDSSPAIPGNGFFARAATTNATGDFTVSGVPSRIPMRVIFNPSSADLPPGSNITLAPQNTNLGRRSVPDTMRPLNAIIVPSGDNFVVNDTGTVTINGQNFTVDTSANPDTAADERVPVIVPTGPTISGVVSVNGAPVAGATVQLFNADGTLAPNPVQTTTGSGAVTAADGVFSFVDVSAKTQANGGTPYFIRVKIVRDGTTFIRSIPITLFQGQDATQTANFILATLSGKVVQGNNVPVSGATVTLKKEDGTALVFNNTDGTTFTLTRTAKTDASGNYSLVNVPVGGFTYDPATKAFTQDANATDSSTTRYSVFAQSGTLTGSSGSVAVRAIDGMVLVPTIQLVNQQLTGKVFSQIVTANGNYTTPFSGATVELLDQNGNSLSPVITMTSAADGSYSFSGVKAGTYRIRATGKGDTVTSGTFTATTGASTGPDVTLVLHVVFGAVFDTANKGVGGATVTLTQKGVVVATTTSTSTGNYQLDPVAARGNDTAGNNFVVNAVKGTLSGSTPVPGFARGTAPRPITVIVKVAPVVSSNPTTFSVGRTYAISLPYETSTNATTRNIFDRTSGDAIVPMSQAFNFGPTGVNASNAPVRFYTVSRFNPQTLVYEAVPDGGNLIRGEGYLLKVTAQPVTGPLHLQMPSDDAALKPLSVGSASVTDRFLINLGFNASSSNSLNGRNLIGFGFDPAKFSSVVWNTSDTNTDATRASVQVQFGTQRLTLYQAVQQGLIFPSLTTVDPATGRTIIVNSLSPYGGYFVQARKAGVKLLLLPANNGNN